jgi:hypothetical protein
MYESIQCLLKMWDCVDAVHKVFCRRIRGVVRIKTEEHILHMIWRLKWSGLLMLKVGTDGEIDNDFQFSDMS